MSVLLDRWVAAASVFEPRQRWFAAGRSLLALAELSVLLFTSDDALFLGTAQLPSGARCAGIRSVSFWCWTGGDPGAQPACRLVTCAVLVVTAVGYRPRWTCVPHWYVTFSLGAAMTVANGGEGVARIVTLLLIPLCLGDARQWQWTVPREPLPARWRGSAHVAGLVIRAQVTVVYLDSALSKVVVAEWRDGTALSEVILDPYYGAAPLWQHWAGALAGPGPATVLLGWGTIIGELAIAVLLWAPPRARRAAAWIAVPLHGGIMVLMGLVSFGAVMIGAVLLAASSGTTFAPQHP
ncbi:sporulation-delaying protein SdpB family protein [Amycolatopsis sp. NPDC051106]|uniref:sporulation-delaying protein SdpB family protein n=1 Tax=unclassified Amycolatopsis TaxID=2618356 RepID=UPI0034132278